MSVDQATLRKLVSKDLTETFIRIGLALLLVIVCVRVFMPFAHLVVMAAILAIALYPLYLGLLRLCGGSRALAASLLVLGSLLLLGVPMAILGSSLAGEVSETYQAVENRTIGLKPPDPKVAQWPLIGERLYSAWSDAAANLPAYIEKNWELIRGYSRKALAMAATGVVAFLSFLAAIIVAGVMMAYAEGASRAIQRILVRLSDAERGPRLQTLAVATVRSVATGVVGVALIQALLLGMGFLLAGIPAPGVLAMIVMFVGILQLPVVVISLPAVAYLWWAGDNSTTMNVIFSIYFILAGLADNVLKPLLLGRGVDAPMLVILIGAIGGMVTGGITGLFVGAVVLAVGYQIFMGWVDGRADAPAEGAPADVVRPDAPA